MALARAATESMIWSAGLLNADRAVYVASGDNYNQNYAGTGVFNQNSHP